MNSKNLIVCLIILITGISGCKDKSVELTGLSVYPSYISLVYGGTSNSQQITAEAIPQNATDVKFTWTSDNHAIATVSETGLVTATGVGSTQITVTAKDRNKKVSVMVLDPNKPTEPDPEPDPDIDAPNNPTDGYTTSAADTWVATDALGREIGTQKEYGAPKTGVVGIFYFIWLGSHGYDSGANYEEVQRPGASDTKSPYDITKLLAVNPSNPQYGPAWASHHWSEPYFNYYVSNDEWVIEKHIQLLADAGVDVIFFDNTNAFVYLSTIQTICRVMERMRAQGRTTPKIASMINSNPSVTLQKLYDGFYAKGLYHDLWFYWKDKPLVLCPDQNLSAQCRNFFTIRHTWFDSNQSWFGTGKDKWTWGDYYPQKFGWSESSAKAEQISVSAATHPIANIGRSYCKGSQPSTFRSGEGLFFAEQWSRALAVNPEFVFITGWNEWVAQRFTDGASAYFLGKKISIGDTYFVDQYNEEFSRDIEPIRGSFGDNYYYQMVDNIRRYKGVQAMPVANGQHTVNIDGNAADWNEVAPAFFDDKGDITSRNHYGWGRIGQLTNNNGRNDFVWCKLATDSENVYFCMRTEAKVALTGLPLQLFIKTAASESTWEGFQYRVDVKTDKAELYVSKGGWNWDKMTDVTCLVNENFIELSVSLQQLGLTTGAKTIDFKWADNMPQTGDIRNFMDHGDSAPNARFRYRYILKN